MGVITPFCDQMISNTENVLSNVQITVLIFWSSILFVCENSSENGNMLFMFCQFKHLELD